MPIARCDECVFSHNYDVEGRDWTAEQAIREARIKEGTSVFGPVDPIMTVRTYFECRFASPTLAAYEEGHDGWPTVKADDWCGRYIKRLR